MSDEKPYGDTFMEELARLHEAQSRAAGQYASHMIYMKHKLYMRDDSLRTRRAQEAEADFLRLDAEISALNAAEYRKKQAAS